ncbi:hypothetical protein Thermo_01013 [Thermoplasmatales archaeon]|nr:hypothetical protein Thermo_01013 [Thermoplasmatales archaeon]
MYSYEKDYDADVDEMYGRISRTLKSKGYIILSYVDMKQILETNFKESFAKYYILNVCKPIAAKEIMAQDERMGLFIPCKITLSETKSGTHVSMLRVSVLAKDYLKEDSVAKKYEDELVSAIDSLTQ